MGLPRQPPIKFARMEMTGTNLYENQISLLGCINMMEWDWKGKGRQGQEEPGCFMYTMAPGTVIVEFGHSIFDKDGRGIKIADKAQPASAIKGTK